MSQRGGQSVSIRAQKGWAGITTQTQHDSGDGRMHTLSGVYIASDSSELRTFMGWKCVWDPVSDTNTGYRKLFTDSTRPVTATSGGYTTDAGTTDTLQVRAYETNLHGLAFVHGRPIIYGESEFMREPIYNTGVQVTIASVAKGNPTVLTMSAAPDTSATGENHKLTVPGTAPYPAAQGDVVYINGLTGDPVTTGLLNGKFHKIVAIAGTAVSLSTNTSAGQNLSSQAGEFWRTRIGADYLGGVGYPDIYASGTATQDKDSLTIWWALERLTDDAATVATTAYPSHVFNRQRDFGDAAGRNFEGNAFGAGTFLPFSRRTQRTLPFRMSAHVAGDRLIMAAPGYGCAFQAPVHLPNDPSEADTSNGLAVRADDLLDRPRCAGIPRAVLYEDFPAATGNLNFLGSGAPSGTPDLDYGGSNAAVSGRNGAYKFMAAYRDDATGEIGLPSDVITISTDALTSAYLRIRLWVYHPGYLMPECGALSILIFRTQKGGTTFYYDSTITAHAVGGSALTPAGPGATPTSFKYGLQPSTTVGCFPKYVVYYPIYRDDASLVNSNYVPSIEQMPRGCEDAETIRGWTFYAGGIGDSGKDLELAIGSATGTFTSATDGIHNNPGQITYRNAFTSGTSGVYQEVMTMIGSAILPPAYAAETLASKSLRPYPVRATDLAQITNNRMTFGSATAALGHLEWVRFLQRDTPLDTTRVPWTADGAVVYTLLPRSRYQISEQDHPGVTPATNDGVLDANEVDNIVAIGQANGQALLSTKWDTYQVAWSGSPISPSGGGLPPSNAQPFGCIAARSMVEFDGGAAWISDRGPVAAIGESGATWVGQDVASLFIGKGARYLRDSRGMMRHAFGCHDPERGLVIWGLYTNRNSSLSVTVNGIPRVWTAATDGMKSRFPCDELLIWSYRANAFSTWSPPLGMEILEITRGSDANGIDRLFFLAADKRVYVFDDFYAQGNKDVLELTVSVASTGATVTTTSGTFGSSTANRGTGENFVFTDQDVAIVDSTRQVLKALAKVSSFAAPAITLNGSVTVVAGDILMVGVRIGTIASNYRNFKQEQDPTTLLSIGGRYTIESLLSSTGGGVSKPGWIQAKATVDRRPSGDEDSAGADSQTSSFTGTDANSEAYVFAGKTAANSIVRDLRMDRKVLTGQNHRLTLSLVSGGQFRLGHITAEIGVRPQP